MDTVTSWQTVFWSSNIVDTADLVNFTQYNQDRNFSNLFNGCNKLTTSKLDFLPTGTFDVSGMFYGCTNLKNNNNDLILNWSKIRSSNDMFASSGLVKTPTFGNWNPSSTSGMFSGCINLTTVSDMNCDTLLDFYNMFDGCVNLENVGRLQMIGYSSPGGTLSFKDSNKLTTQSLNNILGSLCPQVLWQFPDYEKYLELHPDSYAKIGRNPGEVIDGWILI